MTVRDIYVDVTSVMLEPEGFTLGLVDDAEFLQYYRQAMEEFLSRSGLAKGVALDAQLATQVDYEIPDWIGDLEAAFSDGATLGRDSEESISAANRNWQKQSGTPRSWRRDKMPMKTMSIYPAPVVDNPQSPNSPAPPNFGVIAAYVPGGDPASVIAFLGTMNQMGQVGIFTSPGDFFGFTDVLQFSRGNVAMIGTLGLFTENVSLDDPIEHITDDWAVAIKYGILKRIFGSDGETRDILRERYANARFEELVMLSQALMGRLQEQ